MEIFLRCNGCNRTLQVSSENPTDTCQNCVTATDLTLSDAILKHNVVDVCPRCEKSVFYIQRDFNQKVGVGIMVIFALLGLVCVWLDYPFYFYVCLGAGALLDLLLFALLPEITICYACKTAFRNVNSNPDHKPFDLHVADIYDSRSKG